MSFARTALLDCEVPCPFFVQHLQYGGSSERSGGHSNSLEASADCARWFTKLTLANSLTLKDS